MPLGRKQANLELQGANFLESGATFSAKDGDVTIGGATVSGAGFPARLRETITAGQFAAISSTSSVVNMSTLPSGAYVLGGGYTINTGLSGGCSAARLFIGTSAVSGGMILSESVYTGKAAGYYGPANVPQYSALDHGQMAFPNGTTALATVVTSGGNLSALTQGTFIAEVVYMVPR